MEANTTRLEDIDKVVIRHDIQMSTTEEARVTFRNRNGKLFITVENHNSSWNVVGHYIKRALESAGYENVEVNLTSGGARNGTYKVSGMTILAPEPKVKRPKIVRQIVRTIVILDFGQHKIVVGGQHENVRRFMNKFPLDKINYRQVDSGVMPAGYLRMKLGEVRHSLIVKKIVPTLASGPKPWLETDNSNDIFIWETA